MTRTRRILVLLAAALVTAALSSGPAAASGKGGGGGGGGGGATQPTPPPVFVDPCAPYFDLAFSDGTSAVVNRTAGGCVIVKHFASGVNLLYQVALVPGWSYTIVSNGGGTSSRVQLDFNNASTGAKAQIRVENGKTVIS
jgi:hypothetical protein